MSVEVDVLLVPTNICSRYSDGSFMKTNASGASVTFTFYGTEVWVFGGKRPNHGNYEAGVDGNLQGYPGRAERDFFNQTLFTQSGLSRGQHTVRLVNTEQVRFLDVDYVRPSLDIADCMR